MAVELDIVKKTYDLVQITTFNVYGDETRIELKNVSFDNPPPEGLFRFDVPEGADVLQCFVEELIERGQPFASGDMQAHDLTARLAKFSRRTGGLAQHG